MWEVLLTNQQKSIEKSQNFPVDVIGGRLKFRTEPHFNLVVLSAIKVNYVET